MKKSVTAALSCLLLSSGAFASEGGGLFDHGGDWCQFKRDYTLVYRFFPPKTAGSPIQVNKHVIGEDGQDIYTGYLSQGASHMDIHLIDTYEPEAGEFAIGLSDFNRWNLGGKSMLTLKFKNSNPKKVLTDCTVKQ